MRSWGEKGCLHVCNRGIGKCIIRNSKEKGSGGNKKGGKDAAGRG